MSGIFTPLEWALAAARAILWVSTANARAGCGFSSRQAPRQGTGRSERANPAAADSAAIPDRFCPICPADAARQRGAGLAMLHFRIDRLYSKARCGADRWSATIWKDRRKSRNRKTESDINHVCFGIFSQSDVPCRERDGYDHSAYPAWCALFAGTGVSP
jgi:hypothetical protein